jgi:hypothetical protein
VPESVNHEFSTSYPKPTAQTFDSSVLDELVNHCSGELLGFEQNIERASEIASDEAVSEIPQQQQPEQRPNSPKLSHLLDQSLINVAISEEHTLVMQPLSVALPSESTHEPEQSNQCSTSFPAVIKSNLDARDEIPIQTGLTLDSSLPYALERVDDPPYVPAIDASMSNLLNHPLK